MSWPAGERLQMQARPGLEGRRSRCGTKWSNGAGRDPRNPGKPLKNGLLAIFEPGFSCKNPRTSAQTFDAPSMALLVGQVKNGKMFFF